MLMEFTAIDCIPIIINTKEIITIKADSEEGTVVTFINGYEILLKNSYRAVRAKLAVA